MSQGDIVSVLKDALMTTLVMAAPFLAVSVGIGILVSVVQAATQIHEQNVGFVFKILGIAVALILLSSWLIAKSLEFTNRIFAGIANLS
jgi:flagellar biosynthetic protein FliQ